eukprot:TRINITY_DN2463_c0_g1_i2.p1 TRINITY_DN2463_c0_g1~~TRINITY_DN2463_c0_g1_i2.p1  ORF type:complete len:679 (-),score=97.07 TRINITY_DN2463_c0_g1_i2:2038-4074(-)
MQFTFFEPFRTPFVLQQLLSKQTQLFLHFSFCKSFFFIVAIQMSDSESEYVSSDVSDVEDEYSEEEEVMNTVGNIPMEWYDDYDHIGYDIEGKPIMRPPQRDEVQKFLDLQSGRAFRLVRDDLNQRDVELSNEDLDLIKRLQTGRFPKGVDPFEDFSHLFATEPLKYPLIAPTPKKSSFTPSKYEASEVRRLVKVLKEKGVLDRPLKTKPASYDQIIWNDDEVPFRRSHLAPPPRALPGHAESYNPPDEYVPDQDELDRWAEMDPQDRPLDFIPRKYNSLRRVPLYIPLLEENYKRCLSLYVLPRQRRMRSNDRPEDLLPKLPDPKSLRPYPRVMANEFKSYTGRSAQVTSLHIHQQGQFAVVGDASGNVRVLEILTGRVMRSYDVGKYLGIDEPITKVEFFPGPSVLIAVAIGTQLLFILPKVSPAVTAADTLLLASKLANRANSNNVEWKKGEVEHICAIATHPYEIKDFAWYPKGTYIAVLYNNRKTRPVVLHNIAKSRTDIPIASLKGDLKFLNFHPFEPILFITSNKLIRGFDLTKNLKLVRRIVSGVEAIQTIAFHPSGNHVITGAINNKVSWFDMDIGQYAYKVLDYHKSPVYSVSVHERLPLFASGSKDGKINVFHGNVTNDNVTIVPVKALSIVNERDSSIGVSKICWHPYEPWIFAGYDDGMVRLFTE